MENNNFSDKTNLFQKCIYFPNLKFSITSLVFPVVCRILMHGSPAVAESLLWGNRFCQSAAGWDPPLTDGMWIARIHHSEARGV